MVSLAGVALAGVLALSPRAETDGSVHPLVTSGEFATPRMARLVEASDIRATATVVLTRALGDASGRAPVDPRKMRVARHRLGWICRYFHDAHHVSEVRFNRRGVLTALEYNPPPVL